MKVYGKQIAVINVFFTAIWTSRQSSVKGINDLMCLVTCISPLHERSQSMHFNGSLEPGWCRYDFSRARAYSSRSCLDMSQQLYWLCLMIYQNCFLSVLHKIQAYKHINYIIKLYSQTINLFKYINK